MSNPVIIRKGTEDNGHSEGEGGRRATTAAPFVRLKKI